MLSSVRFARWCLIGTALAGLIGSVAPVYGQGAPALTPGTTREQELLPPGGSAVPVVPPGTDPVTSAAARRWRARMTAWTGRRSPASAPFPRLGNFPVPPTGPGYYSLLDQTPRRVPEGAAEVPVPAVRADPAVVLRRDNFALPRRPEEHRARLLRPAQAHPARRRLAVRHRRRRPRRGTRTEYNDRLDPAGQQLRPDPRPRLRRPVVPGRLPPLRRVHRRVRQRGRTCRRCRSTRTRPTC